MLRQGEILTLDDNRKYTVVSTAELNAKHYVYLIDQDDYTNVLVCESDNENGLEEVVDSDLVEQLMIYFKDNAIK